MSDPSPPSPRERLLQLYAKVEAFFTAAHARHGTSITCHAGCSDCCRRRFSVLDQTTLSTVLGALDAAHADAAARPRGERVEIADVLVGA